MNFFPKIQKWFIPEAALKLSKAEMAVDGRSGNEGTALWLGTKNDGNACVSHLAFLRGPGIQKSPLNVIITPELMREVHEQAEAHNVILIGQIHSHDGYYGVDLSSTDHRFGFRVPYFLSLVCPDFGQTEDTTIYDCGVHVFLPNKGFVRMRKDEITQKIIITPSTKVPVITVGES